MIRMIKDFALFWKMRRNPPPPTVEDLYKEELKKTREQILAKKLVKDEADSACTMLQAREKWLSDYLKSSIFEDVAELDKAFGRIPLKKVD